MSTTASAHSQLTVNLLPGLWANLAKCLLGSGLLLLYVKISLRVLSDLLECK